MNETENKAIQAKKPELSISLLEPVVGVEVGNTSKFKEILKSKSSKVCVIAGPGSGKTKGVLIPKAKSVIVDSKADPKEVLIISFSFLSARDLRRKICNELQNSPRASTLHSYCLSFLMSEDSHDIRKRVNTILMEFERDVLIADLKEILPGEKKNKIRTMLDEFSAGWARNSFSEIFDEDQGCIAFKSALMNWLDEYQAAMMEEIVYNAVRLASKVDSDFIKNPKYIFVDEYQDLNKLEQEFVNILAKDSKLLLVVGDPDQSIYSFKFAFPKGIVDFANREDVEAHSLEYIGRCPQMVVDFANQVLTQLHPGQSNLLKCLPNAAKGSVVLKQYATQSEEFKSVLSEIKDRIKNGVDPDQMVILVPRKKLGEEFVKYVNESGEADNPHVALVVKGNLTKEEKEGILLLGIIVNPGSMLRIRSYVGMDDSETHGYYAHQFNILKSQYDGSVENVINKACTSDCKNNETQMKKVCERIQFVREFIKRNEGRDDLNQLIEEIFPRENEGYRRMRSMIDNLREDNDTIQTLYSKLTEYIRRDIQEEGNVRVMTILASKGLEADHVFIIGCNDGNIPGKRRSEFLSDIEHKEEQRRLLYVGITRAKVSLTLTWSNWIPYSDARQQYTGGLRVRRGEDGQLQLRVNISEFLESVNV